jgi:hypothetical protein
MPSKKNRAKPVVPSPTHDDAAQNSPGVLPIEDVDAHASNAGFTQGSYVVVDGLSGRVDLNGRSVELLQFSAGRWAVRVVATGESVRVRPANLVPSNASGTLAQIDDEYVTEGHEPEVVLSVMQPPTIEGGVASCLRELAKLPAHRRDTWYLFVRRHHVWLGGPGRDKKRFWWVTLVTPAKGGRELANVFGLDGPRLSEVVTASIAPEAVAACIAALAAKVNFAPKTIAIACFGHAFRMRSAHALGSALATTLASASLDVRTVPCAELADESSAGSLVGLALARKTPPGRVPLWLHCKHALEDHFTKIEASLLASYRGVHISHRLNGLHHGANSQASIAAVRELLGVGKAFHDAAPWTVLTNDDYLHVRDARSGEEGWVIVCGHTDYDARGLNVYESWHDMEASRRDATLATDGWMERLQYVAHDLASFATLDTIAELAIPLPQEPTGEDVPLWYRRMQPERRPRRLTETEEVDDMVRCWSEPPALARWPFLAALTRATIRLAADSSLSGNPVELFELEGLTVVRGGWPDTHFYERRLTSTRR